MRYIGSKINLLSEINNIIVKNINKNENIDTFLDLFSGTNSVSNFFKDKYTIYSNDILFFNFVNAKAIIESNDEVKFERLKNKGIKSPIDYLQKKSRRLFK